jgi:hypothetical protein
MQRQRRLLALAALAGLGLAALGPAPAAVAQPQPFTDEPVHYRSNRPYEAEVERAEKQRAAEAGEGPESPLRITGGLDVRSQYFFRGYNRISSGLAVQPYADIGYTVFDNGKVAITPHAGGWADIAEQKGPNPPVHINEFRYILGVGVQVSHVLLDFQYVNYSSPSDAFDETREIGVDARYDDRWCWRADSRCPLVALNPSFSLFYEAKDFRDNDYNTFVGVGLEPTLRTFEVGRLPLTVSFPLTVGGSYDGYYKDDDGHTSTFGFWEAGVRCGLPLGRWVYGGRWWVDAEVDYIRLLADSAEAANGHDGDDVVFRLGLSFR